MERVITLAATERDIESFAHFAKGQLRRGGDQLTIDELFDQWRIQRPPLPDLLAIRASIRDMENGERGRPFDGFAEDFWRRNDPLESDGS